MAHAAGLDVTIHEATLEPGVLGFYEPSEARIYIARGLTPAEGRSVLAHECGHVYYGDECGSDAAERRADAYAADLLISADAYAEAENLGGDVHDLADELCITPSLVEAYQVHCMQQIGHTTYWKRHRGRFTTAMAHRLT